MQELWSLSYVSMEEALVRLLLASALAGLIGLDREVRNKPVGLRTMMLVSLGAAAFSIVVMELIYTIRDDDQLAMDPGRVISGIIGGVGFLGAGAIIQQRQTLVGATTGASIWVVGGIGMGCGFGFYVLAATVTAIALVVLIILGVIERWIGGRKPQEEAPEPGDEAAKVG